MDDDPTIASLSLDMIAKDGAVRLVRVSVDRPEQGSDGDWSCRVSLLGLAEKPAHIFGVDSLQALTLGLAYVRSRLSLAVDRGNALQWTETGEGFALDAYFPSG